MTTFDAGYGVMVIGGGAGIGQAAAEYLAARGASVIVVDRDRSSAVATVTNIEKAGRGAIALGGDVTDAESIREAVRGAIDWNGQVHALVNTAGIQGPLGKPSHEVEIEDFERTLRVNLTAGLVIAREVIPHMLEHGYGRIAHVASIAGKEGNPNMVAYSASKAGLIGLVKSQGKEYAKTGITVNALAPAVIHTPFLDSQPKSVIDYMVEKIPMGRVGTVDETAAMLAFMISPESSFTTGFTFDLSGGRATY
jgi:NAD(P)-dependent dehydrogenase (short-subunit alcohol dehydrogenase family)